LIKRDPNKSCSVRLTTPQSQPEPYQVSSVRKALEALACFSLDKPTWTLSALARHIGIPKSTAHNLLRTLQTFDFVRQDREDRNYRLGPRALEMGLVFSRSTEMLAQVRPVLRRLAERTGETVKMGILSNGEVLIVAAVESAHQLHTRGDIGTRWPVHSTSLGKAILSALPPAEAKQIVERHGMPAVTTRTIQSWSGLESELNKIRTRAVAFDLEENEIGVRCVAAPLVDPLRGSVAAISVSGPRVRLEDERLAQLARDLSAAARTISAHSQLHPQEES
jgi:DNA-binding IclR family transcriptional regulator